MSAYQASSNHITSGQTVSSYPQQQQSGSGKSSTASSTSSLTHRRHTSQSSLSSIASTSTLPSNQPLDPGQSSIRDENEKLNKRLLLLREEYVKLQSKHADLQTRYDRLASTGSLDPDTADFTSNKSTTTKDSSVAFVTKVLNFIGNLCNNAEYSDLTVELADGQLLKAHKFVLKFRSLKWGTYGELENVNRMELKELSAEVGLPLFRWIYTGAIVLNSKSENYILGMFYLKFAN